MRDRGRAGLVTTAHDLLAGGVTRPQLANELENRRWQRAGHAVVLHNGPLTRAQQLRVGQIHAGPRSLFTAFTAGEIAGLQNWSRDEVHLLAAAGTRLRSGSPVPVRLHLHGPRQPHRDPTRSIEALPYALVRAAATFTSARPAAGLLAAAVQQRLVPASELSDALHNSSRTRHRAILLAAVEDIEGGAQALSEIDFARLCRRHGLPEPVRQRVRVEPSGRRRYLDASWRRRDGRLVVAEIDGALHLVAGRSWDDQLRQNELMLADALVLRYPSIVLRTDEALVVRQLRRALWL